MITDSSNIYDIASILALQLESHGVKHIFVSPGSRNASLLEALDKLGAFDMRMIVDERSAAFAALGYCVTADEPVALVCTSGTAPLNYSPAVAEAYYRHTPLIVITADRPAEWINQDDSQTIMQNGIYHNFIKAEVDIPVITNEPSVWFANRSINELLLKATTDLRGPVHINIRIAQPESMVEVPSRIAERVVRESLPRPDMVVKDCRELATSIGWPKRIMIIAGFLEPSSRLNRALSRMAEFSNIIVLTETIANLHNNRFIGAIDLTLKQIPDGEIGRYRPDIVITLGGALVSRRIKTFLRTYPPQEHWHVGLNDNIIDNFRALSRLITMRPDIFFEQFAAAMQPHKGEHSYSDDWHILSDKGTSVLTSMAARAPWSDLKAFATVIPMIPKRWNVHYSNGTPIRYAQLFGNHSYHRCECNRGVSGIDGCTSTAIGASLAYAGTTLLISGDVSALYDLSAFAISAVDHRYKMIVINNGGGGIFRFINATKQLAITPKYLSAPLSVPFANIAEGFGFEYFRADSDAELREQFARFAAEATKPSLLEIVTPAELSAEILDSLLN